MAIGWPLLLLEAASGHPPFPSYLQHRVLLLISSANIDVHVELTFTNDYALAMRRKLDADRDEIITPSEVQAFLSRSKTEDAGSMALSMDQRDLPLVPLYPDEIDLLGETRVSPSPLVYRLFYFARTPADGSVSRHVQLVDQLYPSLPALCLFTTATGEDDISVEAVSPETFTSADAVSAPRVMEAKVDLPAVVVNPMQEANGAAAESLAGTSVWYVSFSTPGLALLTFGVLVGTPLWIWMRHRTLNP